MIAKTLEDVISGLMSDCTKAASTFYSIRDGRWFYYLLDNEARKYLLAVNDYSTISDVSVIYYHSPTSKYEYVMIFLTGNMDSYLEEIAFFNQDGDLDDLIEDAVCDPGCYFIDLYHNEVKGKEHVVGMIQRFFEDNKVDALLN